MGLMRTLMVASTGAALAYLFDPAHGKERRANLQRVYDEKVNGKAAMSYPDPQPSPIVVPDASRTDS